MSEISRQEFLKMTASAGAALLLSSLETFAKETNATKLRVAVIGCGSVSNRYIPHLQSSPLIEVVSLCDIKYERAVAQKKQLSKRPPQKKAESKKFPLSLVLTIIVLAGAFYFQTQMNQKADGGNVQTEEVRAQAQHQKSESKKELQKITPLLNETKCQTDFEKGVCLTFKVKTEIR